MCPCWNGYFCLLSVAVVTLCTCVFMNLVILLEQSNVQHFIVHVNTTDLYGLNMIFSPLLVQYNIAKDIGQDSCIRTYARY